MSDLQMFDTVTISTVPPNPYAVAGYTSGWWPTDGPLRVAFPHAQHLSIAVGASHDADALDCEPGDATPDQAPAWVKRQLARGVPRPVIYASVSAMPTVQAYLRNAGIQRGQYRIWTAHYNFSPHRCGPGEGFGFNDVAEATQWTDRALNRNLDESQIVSDFFAPPVPVHDQYYFFANSAFHLGKRTVNEQRAVILYDRLLKHPKWNAKKIAATRADLAFLRDRIWFEVWIKATNAGRIPSAKAHFDWKFANRGVRYHALRLRAPWPQVRAATR
jgi:hypothetical protein